MDDLKAIFITTQAVVSAICWLITFAGATAAVFSPRINDTLLERIGLSAVAIAALGTAWRIKEQGWISDGATFLSIALAFYVVTVVKKHINRGVVWPTRKR
jgi:Iap family predicted aminopeptidase